MLRRTGSHLSHQILTTITGGDSPDTVRAGVLRRNQLKRTRRHMADSNQIDFGAPADLRKWPSLNGKRNTRAAHPGPYLVFAGTLDQCMQEFMSRPPSQHHLYEIHTTAQTRLVGAVLSAEHVVELVRLRDFL